MFKSVLSQQVNGFIFYRTISAVYLLLAPHYFFPLFILLLSVLWACLEFTHNAQPHKLTDSRMGHGVIRWRQHHSVSSQYQDQPSQPLWSHASALLRVCYQHNTTVDKMPAKCWFLTPPPPQCLCVTSASAQAPISLLLSGVTKGYIPHFTAYICRIEMPNAALFLFLFWRLSRI